MSQGPGMVCIFNHTDFQEFNRLNNGLNISLSDRKGTEFDVAALEKTFKSYNLTTGLYQDLTYYQIMSIADTLSKWDFSDKSCLVIVVLTHGFKYLKLAAKDQIYDFNDFILKISTNSHLKSKPKIYLLQACRGEIDTLKFVTDGPVMSAQMTGRHFSDEQYLLHSATEAFVTYRHELTGSPFIQTFCDMLNQYGSYKTISDLFDLVKIKVQEITRGAQMPEITSNAVKNYVFGDYRNAVKTTEIQATSTLPVEYNTTYDQTTDGKIQQQNPTGVNVSNPATNVYTPANDKWVKFCSNHLPTDPVVGGVDVDGRTLYVGRAQYEKHLIPGKVFLCGANSIIAVSHGCNEYGISQFEVLTGTGYWWYKPEAEQMGCVPRNAVHGGINEKGEILYIGRTCYEGALTPGKLQYEQCRYCLLFPFAGKQYKSLTYEVLLKTL